MEVAEQSQGVPDGWQVVNAPTAAPKSGGHDFKVMGINIHVPAEEKPRPDSNMIGWGENGAGVAPEDALAVGQIGRRVAGAVAGGGGVVAGVKEALVNATPIAKYEIAHHMLKAAGLPDAAAIPLAMVVSGYKKGTKAEPTPAASPADSPHLDLSQPARPGAMTPAQMAERSAAVKANGGLDFRMPRRGPDGRPVKSPIVAAEPVASPASPAASGPVVPAPQGEPVARTGAAPSTPETQSPAPKNSLPDQKALNEEALARRRAEYQAKQAPAPAEPAKAKLTAPESKEYMRLRQSGKTHPEAMDLIEAQRAFQQRFGLEGPTTADTKFPKGMRGKTP